MVTVNDFDNISVCCLSLRQIMNLRKSRCSSDQKGIVPCKNIKSSVKRVRKSLRHVENKHSFKISSKIDANYQKSIFNVKTSNMNFVTSTPISHVVRKRILRSSGKYDSNKKSNVNSFKNTSSHNISSSVEEISKLIKPCEVRLIYQPDLGLTSEKRSFDSELSHSSVSSPVESSGKNSRTTRSSMETRSKNASKKMQKNIKNSQSQNSKQGRKNVPQSKVQAENKKKHIRKSSTPTGKLAFNVSLAPKDILSISGKFNGISGRKKSLVEQTSKGSLLQSYHEIDNTKSSRYSLRNSDENFKKSNSKRETQYRNISSIFVNSLVAPLSSTPKNSALAKSYAVKKKKALAREVSQNSQISLPKSSNKIVPTKRSRCSLRLKRQQSCEEASHNRLSNKSSSILQPEDIIKKPNYDLEPRSKTKKKSRRASLVNQRLAKRTAVNKSSSQSSTMVQSQQSVNKISTKKRKLDKISQPQDKTSKARKITSNSSKKQASSKKSSDKFQREYFSFSEGIPIDDLAMPSTGRKVKSDGFKPPRKNTLKQKKLAIDAVKKADEDYEDDIYGFEVYQKKFEDLKDVLMDVSDSEKSFSIATPKFPCTPLVRRKTPKFKDCFNLTDYAASRKAALEYMNHRQKKRRLQKPETPVVAEKKTMEYSEALETIDKFRKTMENLDDEESDNDSYFSFS